MVDIVVSRAVAESPSGWLKDCAAAEETGRAGVAAGDLPGCDAFVDAALAISTTRRLEIHIAAALPTRSPLQTAFAAATLARLGPGRVTVGFAPGNRQLNEQGHGVRFDPPITRLREFVRCVCAALRTPAGEDVEVVGDHHEVRATGLGLDRAALPVVIGAHGAAAARLAGEVADGIALHLMTPVGMISDRAALARSVSPLPNFRVSVGRTVSVARDEQLALRDARAETAAFLTLPRFRPRLGSVADADVSEAFTAAVDRGDAAAAATALPEAVIREFVTVTTPRRFEDDIAQLDVDVVVPTPVGTFWQAVPGERGVGMTEATDAVRRLRAVLLAGL